jgi:hypothetical protein
MANHISADEAFERLTAAQRDLLALRVFEVLRDSRNGDLDEPNDDFDLLQRIYAVYADAGVRF